VTGGGIAGNLARILPDGLGSRLGHMGRRRCSSGWRHADEVELGVFNLGIGYLAIVRIRATARGGRIVRA
jgi:phosphoribosylaminoimidazole (AIR) synthetase